MDKNATIGGIFSILAGALGVIGGISFAFLFVFFMRAILESEGIDAGIDAAAGDVLNLIVAIYGAVGVFYALLGVLAIVGGICSLKRRLWGLALAGAITASVVFLPFGIASVVFTTLAKDAFPKGAPALSAAPTAH